MEALILKSVSKVLKVLSEATFFHRSTTCMEMQYIFGGECAIYATVHQGEGQIRINGKVNHSLEFNIYMDASRYAAINCKVYSPQYLPFGKTVKLGLTAESFFQESVLKDLSWTTFEEYDTLNKLRAFFDNEVRNRL